MCVACNYSREKADSAQSTGTKFSRKRYIPPVFDIDVYTLAEIALAC